MAEAFNSVLVPYKGKQSLSTIWSNLVYLNSFKHRGRIASISVCKKYPYKYAIPNGCIVSLCRASNNKPFRRISGFSKPVQCVDFRDDAKLIAVGEAEGLLRLVTTDKNTFHLRKMTAHNGIITKVAFLMDGFRVASLGGDALLRIWDVATGDAVTSYRMTNSTEPAMALSVGRSDSNLLACGNMKGSIHIYDVRQREPAQTIHLRHAVSALAFAGSEDSCLVAASLSWLHAWDVAAARERATTCPDGTSPRCMPALVAAGATLDTADGTRLGAPGLRRHFRMVTDLQVVQSVTGTGQVVLSAGMDRLVKFTSLTDFAEVHTIQSPVPLLSIGATPDCQNVLLGCENGYLRTYHFVKDINLQEDAVGGSKLKKTETEPGDTVATELAGGSLGGDLDALVAHFSGHWRGGGPLGRDALRPVDDWLCLPTEATGGCRWAPRDWLPSEHAAQGERVRPPLVHPDTELSRADLNVETARGLSAAKRALRGRLTRADNFLRRFDHSRALSQALLTFAPRCGLDRSKRQRVSGGRAADERLGCHLAVAVVNELHRRGTLAPAVAGRTEPQLARLLRFVRRHVIHHETAPICLQLFNCVIDVYPAERLASNSEFCHITALLRASAKNITNLQTLPAFAKATQQRRSADSTSLSPVVASQTGHPIRSLSDADSASTTGPGSAELDGRSHPHPSTPTVVTLRQKTRRQSLRISASGGTSSANEFQSPGSVESEAKSRYSTRKRPKLAVPDL